VKIEDGPGWLRLILSGEIDLAWCESHRADIEIALQNMPPLVFVDLEHVSFLDSTGIGLLVQVHRHSELVDGEVCVVCPRPFVARTLGIAGLDDVLTIVTSPSEAKRIYAGVGVVDASDSAAHLPLSEVNTPTTKP